MRTTRIVSLVPFCLAAALASIPVAAQSAALVPGRFTAAIGAGYGGTTLSCGGCSSSRESSFAFVLRAGAAVTRNLVFALEVTGWRKDFTTSTSNGTARVGFADLVAQWYPVRSAGLFVKGGGGLATIRDDIATTGLPLTRIETNSSDLLAGIGWDLPFARPFWLTPYADFHRAPQRSAKVNGGSSAQELGATLIHVGVAATWR
jgi:hypothetical protein